MWEGLSVPLLGRFVALEPLGLQHDEALFEASRDPETLRPEHRSLEVGWTWLARAVWETGVNVEAKLLMLEHAFERMGCQRVEFKTDARNARSRAALAALPAAFEGILRRHMVMPYGVRDSAYYSVIADEWPEVRAQLEHRRDAKAAAGSTATTAMW